MSMTQYMTPSIVLDELNPGSAHQRMPAGRDAARELADRTIERLKELVIEWKAYRNTFSPIGCLPEDVLTQIFLRFRDAVVASFDRHRTLSYTPLSKERNRWIVLCHVCRKWRETSLDCKALWASICITSSTNSAHFIGLQIDNSRPLPIDLSASLSHSRHRTMVKDISKMPGVNFNKLVLYGNDHGRVLKNFTVASTSLRHLAIKNSEIPESLFAGDTPQLQVLKLRECSKISWDCGIFRSEHLEMLMHEVQLAPAKRFAPEARPE
ncbi:hypothetical protein NMY22_g13620 [Coprinellus aureogranulatus]|nr:hypothetical protein NMY22_g13620 [Coprinellus aureogranulatus]